MTRRPQHVKKPSRPLERTEGVVPTDEERDMSIIPQTAATVETDAELVMCDVCGTTRTTKSRGRTVLLRCVTCKASTVHSRPFGRFGDYGEDVNADSTLLRDLMRDVSALERLGVDVDLDAQVDSGTMRMRMYDGDIRDQVDFQAGLSIKVKRSLMDLVWRWLRERDRWAAEPGYLHHDEDGEPYVWVGAAMTAALQLEIAADALELENAVRKASR